MILAHSKACNEARTSDVPVLWHMMFYSAHVVSHKPDIASGICRCFWSFWFSVHVGAAKCCQLWELEAECLIWLGSAAFEGLVSMIFEIQIFGSGCTRASNPAGRWMVIKRSCCCHARLLSVVLTLWLPVVLSDRWIMKLNKVTGTAELNCVKLLQQHPTPTDWGEIKIF